MLYIGLMSGTSLDGIDAAVIETDGENIQNFGKTLYQPYDEAFKAKLKSLILGEQCDWLLIEKELTELHAKAVNQLLGEASLNSSDISAVGFHGQTIVHRPKEGITWQIGNSALLSELTRINVISDFRRRDVANGGQGAPLVPIFHKALIQKDEMPGVILNLGGVSNITYINDDQLIAYDCGPANAIINDACLKYFNKPYDDLGAIASQGIANDRQIQSWLEHPYFKQQAPKSIDRNEFKNLILNFQNSETNKYNVIASLTKFVAWCITDSVTHILPSAPKIIYAAGGGVKNTCLMDYIKQGLPKTIRLSSINEKGLNADFIEAQAFAYLAARALKGLPISFPTTTGNCQALCGAAFYRF
jgi:anhydro-N-acetylmuramic acid kinase